MRVDTFLVTPYHGERCLSNSIDSQVLGLRFMSILFFFLSSHLRLRFQVLQHCRRQRCCLCIVIHEICYADVIKIKNFGGLTCIDHRHKSKGKKSATMKLGCQVGCLVWGGMRLTWFGLQAQPLMIKYCPTHTEFLLTVFTLWFLCEL